MKTLLNVKARIIIIMLLTMNTCFGFAQADEKPTITKRFVLNQPGTLNSKSSCGSITVKTHNEGNVIVQVYIRNKRELLDPSDPMVAEILKGFELKIKKDGSVIYVNAERIRKSELFKKAGISFTIIVPQEMSCNVSSSGGRLKISRVNGKHDFESSGGSISLENTAGTTNASSSGGSIKAIGHKGDIHLSSSGGRITLEDVHGGVYAHSSGGSVNVSGECDYVNAKSSGGSVHVNIYNLSKELYLQSSGGGIDAIIQNGNELGLDLDLNSYKINIDLQNFSGKTEKNHVKGTLNDGGIPVYMDASGGAINVRYQN